MGTVIGTVTLLAQFYNAFESMPLVDHRTPWIARLQGQTTHTSSPGLLFNDAHVLAKYEMQPQGVVFLKSSGPRDAPWCGAIGLSNINSPIADLPEPRHKASSLFTFLVNATTASAAADNIVNSMKLINQTLPPQHALNKKWYAGNLLDGILIGSLTTRGLVPPKNLVFNGKVSLHNGETVLERAFDRYWASNPSNPTLTTRVSDVKRAIWNDEEAYGATIDAEWQSKGEITQPVVLYVVLQEDNSILLTDSLEGTTSSAEAFTARAEELSNELLTVATQRDAGIDARVPVRDLRAEFLGYDAVTQAHGLEWLIAYNDAVNQVNASKLGTNEEALLEDYGLNKQGEETLTDYLTRKTQEQGAKPGTPLWTSAWTGIKGVASKAVDYVGKWSPVDLAAGYAGYKTISSIEKSSIPSWMIYGGLGLVALMVLK